MSNTLPADLAAEWRRRAAAQREFGDPRFGVMWEKAADELESALAAQPDETLSLVEAARVSGFTADHLGHLIKTEKIPNYGRKGAPRIKRSDLPLKQPGGRGPKPKLKSVPAVDKIDVRRVAQSFTKERKR